MNLMRMPLQAINCRTRLLNRRSRYSTGVNTLSRTQRGAQTNAPMVTPMKQGRANRVQTLKPTL